MPRVPLLADMNVSPETVVGLRQHGWDVIRVSDRLPPTSPDRLVLDLAAGDGRTIVTHDLDFSALVAIQGRTRPSLITIRIAKPDPEVTLERLLAVLPGIEEDLLKGVAVTVEESKVRVRRLPIE